LRVSLTASGAVCEACRAQPAETGKLPGFDGTGPTGQGPMTGRCMGFCVLKVPQKQADPAGMDRKEVRAMPAGDGTGPLGFGPMTGRAAGYCAGYPIPGYMNPLPGRGFWMRPFAGAYGPTPYARAMIPHGYGAAYGPVWGRPFGRFGRGFGRGWGRGFGRGRGWFGW